VFSALNAPRQRRYEQELEHLGSLPAFRFADDELLTGRVRRTSTIEVRPGGAQAPPCRGGEPLAHGARQLFRLQHARGGFSKPAPDAGPGQSGDLRCHPLRAAAGGGGKAPAPERSANSWHPWPGPPWHSGSTGCSWRSIQIRITPSTMGPTWCRWTGLNLCWSSSWQQLMALRTAMEGGLAPSGL
jgi:hypothetical protein